MFMGEIEVIGQLINSMSDAVEKLEQAKDTNNIQEYNKIKAFMMDLHIRLKVELSK